MMSKKNKNNTHFLRSDSKLSDGFSVPENYFETLEDSLQTAVAADQFPKENGYSVPARYFETFDNALFEKVGLSKKEIKVISLRNRLFTYIPSAAAACVLLFFGLNYFTAAKTNLFDNISKTDIETWVDQNYLDLNTINLPSEFNDIDFTQSDALVDDASTLSDEDILEYLNSIDDRTLITNTEY